MKKPLAVDDLLAQLEAAPGKGAALVASLHRFSNRAELLGAVGADPRFRAPLAAVLSRPADLKDAPWLVQLAARQGDPALVPALVGVWRARLGSASEQAGQALLALGVAEGLEALAQDVAAVGGLGANLAMQAILRLGGGYDRLRSAVAKAPGNAPTLLWLLARSPELLDADPRWVELAMDSLASEDPRVAEAARAVVTKGLPAAGRQRLLDRHGPAIAPVPPSEQHARALEENRAQIAKLVAKLPSRGWKRAGPEARLHLDELELLLGQVPAAVRAFFEAIDSIDLSAPKPRDRFAVLSLAEVLAAARTWDGQHSPRSTARPLVPPFLWPVAPDGFTKAGFSGGPPVSFRAPTLDEDPVLDAPRKPTFSAFVRRAARRS